MSSRCVFILVILGEIDLAKSTSLNWMRFSLAKPQKRAQRLSILGYHNGVSGRPGDHDARQRGFATKCRALTVLKTCSGVNRLAKQTTRGMVKTKSGCNAQYQQNYIEKPLVCIAISTNAIYIVNWYRISSIEFSQAKIGVQFFQGPKRPPDKAHNQPL